MIPYNRTLKETSRTLRKNMTEAERHLWSKIRMKQLGYQFYRQKPIGNYIVDFYCPKARLVVEVDGGQHYFADAAECDKVRDECMRNLGLMVLRFSNADVLRNIEGTVEMILEQLTGIPLSPPLGKGEMTLQLRRTNDQTL